MKTKSRNGRAYAHYAEEASLAFGRRYRRLTALIEAGRLAEAARYAKRHGLIYPRK